MSPRRGKFLQKRTEASGLAGTSARGQLKDILCCGAVYSTEEEVLRHHETRHSFAEGEQNHSSNAVQPDGNVRDDGVSSRAGKETASGAIPITSDTIFDLADDELWSVQMGTTNVPITSNAFDTISDVGNGISHAGGGLFPARTGNADADLSAILANEPPENDTGSQILAKRNLSAAGFSVGSSRSIELKKLKEEFQLSCVDFSDVLEKHADPRDVEIQDDVLQSLPSPEVETSFPQPEPASKQQSQQSQKQQVANSNTELTEESRSPTDPPPLSRFESQFLNLLQQRPVVQPIAPHPPLNPALYPNFFRPATSVLSQQLQQLETPTTTVAPSNQDIIDRLASNLQSSSLTTPLVTPSHPVRPTPFGLPPANRYIFNPPLDLDFFGEHEIPDLPPMAPPPRQPKPRGPKPPKKFVATSIPPKQLLEPKPHPCNVRGCGKSYKNPGGLKYHMEHGHPERYIPPPGYVPPNTSYTGPRHYMCPMLNCEKAYKNFNGLKYHLGHAHELTEEEMAVPLSEAKTAAAEAKKEWTYVPRASPSLDPHSELNNGDQEGRSVTNDGHNDAEVNEVELWQATGDGYGDSAHDRNNGVDPMLAQLISCLENAGGG